MAIDSQVMNYKLGYVDFLIGSQTEIYGNFHTFIREDTLAKRLFLNISDISKILRPLEISLLLNFLKYRNPITGLIQVDQNQLCKDFNVCLSTIEKSIAVLRQETQCPHCQHKTKMLNQFKFPLPNKTNKNGYCLDSFCLFLEHLEQHKIIEW